MKMNKQTLMFGGLVVGIIALLLLARTVSDKEIVSAAYWGSTQVACLSFGHQNLAQHIHASLSVVVDGTLESIPKDVGVSTACMAEAHTHEEDGTIHLESIAKGKTFTLNDFFAVWDKSLERNGYTLSVTFNGEPISDVGARAISDGDAIVVSYASIESVVE